MDKNTPPSRIDKKTKMPSFSCDLQTGPRSQNQCQHVEWQRLLSYTASKLLLKEIWENTDTKVFAKMGNG